MSIIKISSFLLMRNNGLKIIGENCLYNCNESYKILFKEKYRIYLKKIIKFIQRNKEFNKEIYVAFEQEG